MPGSEDSGLLSGSVALNKILCLSLWGLKPWGAWGHSGKVMTPGLWRRHRFRVRLVAAQCFMITAVSSGSQVSVVGPEHTCASTHTHTHTHTPSCLQSSGTRACPHHRGDYKGKDAAHLPGRCSKRLGLGTSCPGPGVIILDGCRSLAETRCIWLCWELGILDSKPPLCLVNCVTLQ